MGASYTKLHSGEWGVRVDGKPAVGSQVTVTKKAGGTSVETISGVVWSGPDRTFPSKTVSICAIERTPSGSRGRSSSRGNLAPYGQRCPECGSRECAKAWDSSDLCDED